MGREITRAEQQYIDEGILPELVPYKEAQE